MAATFVAGWCTNWCTGVADRRLHCVVLGEGGDRRARPVYPPAPLAVGLWATLIRGSCSVLVLLAYLLLVPNKDVNGHDIKGSGYPS